MSYLYHNKGIYSCNGKLFHNKIDAYYNGVTRNPKSVPFQHMGMDRRDVELNETNSHLRLTTHMGVLVSHPFRFIEKSWVVKQYKEKDLINFLNITRSCEGDFDNLDY
mgnify:CR=1 FL=1